MHIVNKLIVVGLSFFSAACASKPAPTTISPKETELYSTNNSVVFRGAITKNSAADLLTLLESSHLNTLVVTSGGGDVMPAIDIAHYLHKHKINLVIDTLCFSSCANYLLPAANTVTVGPGAILGWHGGAESDYNRWDSKLKEFVTQWRTEERNLYTELGVCWQISTYGQTHINPLLQYTADGWTWSEASYKKLGIDHIEFDKGEPDKPAPHLPKVIPLSFEGPCLPYQNAL